MTVFISILIFLVCLLLIGVVLVQNSKGGGLDSSFSSSNQVMGVRKTADFLEKATWTLVISLFVLCMASAAFHSGATSVENQGSEIQDLINNDASTQAPPVQPPTPPVEVPVQ